jgi:Domain of unknown function (DUF4326)
MKITVTNKKTGGKGEYVGRPSPLGNPFRLEREEDREAVISNYERWLRERISRRDRRVCDELNRLYKKLLEDSELELTCWCAPKPCHADVIRQVLLEAVSRHEP